MAVRGDFADIYPYPFRLLLLLLSETYILVIQKLRIEKSTKKRVQTPEAVVPREVCRECVPDYIGITEIENAEQIVITEIENSRQNWNERKN